MSTSNEEPVAPARRWLLVLMVWAAIYLPALGTLEIKGEEGRRILPAITMLQTGNFIVPYVGSDAYFTKPPLVNWLVAASFKVFGVRNEWAARLPSALSVLAVALAFVLIGWRSLGAHGSLAAALIWMANFGIVEKGRLIEIEAIYVSLTGLAFVCWLSWWSEQRSRWLTWTLPWFFLGLAMLAKGPLHLVFFYAVVGGITYRERRLRELLNPAHFIGLALMLAIFAAWAVPCLRIMQGEGVANIWTHQLSGRLSGEDFKLGGWLLNIPRGLGYFLPWTLLLVWAAVRRPIFESDRTARITGGLAVGIGISFLAVSLLPGALPRYTMPLLVPATWLMALLLTDVRWQLPEWLNWQKPAALPRELRLPVVLAIVAAVGVALYALVVVPLRQPRAKVRPIAAQINAVLPPAEPLYAVDPDYQPALFYVRDPIVYLPDTSQVPAGARFVLVQPQREQELIAMLHASRRGVRPVVRLTDYRKKEIILLEIRRVITD